MARFAGIADERPPQDMDMDARQSPTLRLGDDRAAIHFAGWDERYETGRRGCQDLIVRLELRTVVGRVEDDLHLLPERIHSVRRNGVDDAHERMSGGLARVALI